MRRSCCWTIFLFALMGLSGCLHAPMPWSPDSQWIAYTVEVRPIECILQPGWLFEPTSRPIVPDRAKARPTGYRLWATRKDTGASVLLEDSPHPLTAPGWSPDGRGLAFGRLMVQPEGPARFEVVILDGPTRRRVISSRAIGEINAEASKLPGQAIVWSPDGRFLAIPQLSPLGLAIIRADNGRQINAINDAFLPSWSPDGSHLAFYLRGTGDTLNLLDTPTGQPRTLLEIGQGSQAPIWTKDGLTLLVPSRKSIPRGGEPPGDQVELIRLRVDTGQSEPIPALSTDPILGRDRSIEGISVAFDGEKLLCSTLVEGGPQVITWYHPRDNCGLQEVPPPGHHGASGLPLHLSGRDHAGGPERGDRPPGRADPLRPREPGHATSPDRARRFGPDRVDRHPRQLGSDHPRDPSPPVERAEARPEQLLSNGPPSCRSWASSSRTRRPTARLRRIGRLGRPLCQLPADGVETEPAVAALIDEARLFFDFLSENYTQALQALEKLEARVDSPDRRARLLSVRTQIFLATGQLDRASRSIAFLRDLDPRPARRIEWDGAEYRLTDPDRPRGSHHPGWPDYLAWRVSKAREVLHDDGAGVRFNPDAPRPNLGFEPFNIRGLPIVPERPLFADPVPPQVPANRPGGLPRVRVPNR